MPSSRGYGTPALLRVSSAQGAFVPARGGTTDREQSGPFMQRKSGHPIMSARPGRIKKIVNIDIPYPRTQETKSDPRFLELKAEIWNEVYKEFLEVRK